jgi:rhodanese-related sulfurtransferase
MEKNQKIKIALISGALFLLLALLTTIIGFVESAYAKHIAADALISEIRLSKMPMLIDVRSATEYDAGHIAGAIHVPFWAPWRVKTTLQSLQSQQKSPSATPLIIYCELGSRAGIVGLWLRIAGVGDYVYLDGHMSRWRQLNHPVVTLGR